MEEDLDMSEPFKFVWDALFNQLFLPSAGPQPGYSVYNIGDIFDYYDITFEDFQTGWWNELLPRRGLFIRQPRSCPPYVDLVSRSAQPGEIACPLCDGPAEAVFNSCRHAICSACLVGMWKARRHDVRHVPTWINCPFCRAEVTHIGAKTIIQWVRKSDDWLWIITVQGDSVTVEAAIEPVPTGALGVRKLRWDEYVLEAWYIMSAGNLSL